MAAGPVKQDPPIKRKALAAVAAALFVATILGGVGVATAISYDSEYHEDDGHHDDGDDHAEDDDHSGEDDHAEDDHAEDDDH